MSKPSSMQHVKSPREGPESPKAAVERFLVNCLVRATICKTHAPLYAQQSRGFSTYRGLYSNNKKAAHRRQSGSSPSQPQKSSKPPSIPNGVPNPQSPESPGTKTPGKPLAAQHPIPSETSEKPPSKAEELPKISPRPSGASSTLSKGAKGYQKLLSHSPREQISKAKKSLIALRLSPSSWRKNFPPRGVHNAVLEAEKAYLSFRLHDLPWEQPSTAAEYNNLMAFLKELDLPTDNSLTPLFNCYRKLPGTRLPYLPHHEVRLLLHRYMSVPIRDDVAMLRYLSIIDDMRASNLPILENEWIAAMSFVGQRLYRNTAFDVQATFDLWKEMEAKIGNLINTTAFNVLIDAAAKADQRALVKDLLTQMDDRGIRHDRYTYSTLITYYGGVGFRFKVNQLSSELMASREILDTVLFNSIASAAIKCKEFELADQIFEDMKTAGKNYLETTKGAKDPVIGVNFLLSPAKTQIYRLYGRKLKDMAILKEVYKSPIPVAVPGSVLNPFSYNAYQGPNIVTFNLFILRYCEQGEFEKAEALFLEMKEFNIEYETSIFTTFYKGFQWHGSRDSVSWTKEKLEEIYKIMMMELESGNVKLSKYLLVWVIRAFVKTTRNRKCTIGAYKGLAELWTKERGEMDKYVIMVLQAAIGGPLDVVEEQIRARELTRVDATSNEGVNSGGNCLQI